ncbi:hypothetical protein thsrh120_51150 [Rhizobium sp. No.120]
MFTNMWGDSRNDKAPICRTYLAQALGEHDRVVSKRIAFRHAKPCRGQSANISKCRGDAGLASFHIRRDILVEKRDHPFSRQTKSAISQASVTLRTGVLCMEFAEAA